MGLSEPLTALNLYGFSHTLPLAAGQEVGYRLALGLQAKATLTLARGADAVVGDELALSHGLPWSATGLPTPSTFMATNVARNVTTKTDKRARGHVQRISADVWAVASSF